MPEDVLFEFERPMDRTEIADYLRTVADRLEAGDELAMEGGGESVSLSPPATPTFEVKAERETSSKGGPGELSVEFELEWDEREDGKEGDEGGLSIE
ncbi:amphi-Trp domain-containing protein [Saliphagus sp. LR7]|uniref:amphi-Trp domain-containing protein n=1 Tax=Saliphagus sp. LR7 TaxID=2282654 RepID=UPI000DF854AF|nr:amphi-Trp domain-containing protein [Saliphagus sp. LR7]